jgi:transcriptional regulator with XRE-family HTH domain
MTYDTKAFARRLQEAIDARWPDRRPNDRGQARLAKLTGLPQGQISRMLAGSREPQLGTIALVADKLSVSIDWLVFGAGQMSRSANETAAIAALAAEVRDLRIVVENKRKSDTPDPPSAVRTGSRK